MMKASMEKVIELHFLQNVYYYSIKREKDKLDKFTMSMFKRFYDVSTMFQK